MTETLLLRVWSLFRTGRLSISRCASTLALASERLPSSTQIMSAVIHLLQSQKDHINCSIIKSLVNENHCRHIFWIVRGDASRLDLRTRANSEAKGNGWRFPYIKLVDECRSIDMRFVGSSVSLAWFLARNRNSPIVIHGGSRSMKLLVQVLMCSNVTYVCWGSGISLGSKGLGGKLNSFAKRSFIRHCKRVVCLMTPDAEYLSANYTVAGVRVVPYGSIQAGPVWTIKEAMDANFDCTSVLVGNSARHVDSYFTALKYLARFSHTVRVTCVMGYGKADQESRLKLAFVGAEAFPLGFVADEVFRSKDDFASYLRSGFGIYVCSVETQTGLGVAGMMLSFGKKLYLAGYNYDWFKSLGYIVFHVDDITKMSVEEFVKPLKEEDRIHNFTLRERLLARAVLERRELYSEILGCKGAVRDESGPASV